MPEKVKKPRTVADLRKALEGLPDDRAVWVEGCDCIGEWDGEVVDNPDAETPYLLITRDP